MTERAIPPASERAVQNEILLAASARGYTLFLQNVWVGWTGEARTGVV